MRARQLSFLPKAPPEFGGSLGKGRRKTFRPIDLKRPLHLVLRSSLARGEWSFLHPRNRDAINAEVRRVARKTGVRIYRYANVGNHLHLMVKTPSRVAFRRFLREFSGSIAMRVTGARKGVPVAQLPGAGALAGSAAVVGTGAPAGSAAGAERAFWDGLAFTRIVSWGREFAQLEKYFIKNLFEAAGLWKKGTRSAALVFLRAFDAVAPPRR